MNPPYRGRFAPSPTGPLHFGSLVAAVGSYLAAITQKGEWHLRIEDLDPPREIPGAADAILRCLDAFGFAWHGEVIYQSQRHPAYHAALEQLQKQGLTFPCHCTRKSLSASPIYPGHCRHQENNSLPHAIRLRTLSDTPTLQFNDRLQGLQQQNITREVGDFVIKRADGLFAYQLAVVVDDAALGVTEVVRGGDLLAVTARQIYLQQKLKVTTPDYCHLPLVTHRTGEKLSKQTFAKPLDTDNPAPHLWYALLFLGQAPPAALRQDSLSEIWQWARQNWRIEAIPAPPSPAPFDGEHSTSIEH
ncbi:MAG: tRNA glutamyl-Q(34) synthetase GluQRS [Gammaproteobacteria bacterium]|nr:tRNA glutamyl-Q(34) synthetase GluQRS [Gammaproteobacteria bacterium]MCF6231447.1 tRNA glutamyl-Q(34) synthetase GluQRS [Gammaproteobacteria bacterium]